MADYTIGQWVEAPTLGEGWSQEQEDIIKDFAGTIDLGEYSIGMLVRDMGPYISVEADLTTVATALNILAPVFDRIQIQPGLHDVHLVVEYLCNRLQSNEEIHNYRAGICEIAAALQIMAKWERFPPGDAALTAQSVFALAAGTFKDLTPSTRVELFALIECLFKKYETVLKRDMGAGALVAGLVDMAAIEKSPSCLEVLFPLFTHISQSWDLDTAKLDEIWDSFARYFPVTLGGVKDPSAPSKEKMRDLLLACFISNDHYAENAFEICIAKLDHDSDISANTKKEVFYTMMKCVETYSVPTIAKQALKLWNALKYEIWNSGKEDSIERSLQVLRAVTKTLNKASYGLENNNNEMARYFIEAANECKSKMPDSKKDLLLCGRILRTLASGSPYAFHLITNVVLPAMFVFWQDWKLVSEKNKLLQVFNDLLDARLEQADASTSQSESMPVPPLSPKVLRSLESMKTNFARFRDQINDVYFDAMPRVDVDKITDHDKDHSLELTATKGIASLFRIPSYLSDSERNMIVSDLSRVVLSTETSSDICDSIIAALTDMSAAQPDLFQKIVLVQFSNKLPHFLSLDTPKNKEEDMAVVVSTLEALLQISCTRHCRKALSTGAPSNTSGSYWHRNFDATMNKLFAILDRALTHKGQEDYAKTIIAAVLVGLETFDRELDRARGIESEPEPQSLGEGPYTWILMRLFQLVVEVKQNKIGTGSENGSTYIGISYFPGSNNLWSDQVVEYVGKVAALVERSWLTRKAGNDPIRNWHFKYPNEPSVLWTLFTENEGVNSLGENQYKLEEGPNDKCLAIALSMHLLAGFRPEDSEIRPGNSLLTQDTPSLREVLHIRVGNIAAAMIRNAVSVGPKSVSSTFGRISMLHFLQVLINKYGAFEESTEDGTTQLYDIMQDLVIGCFAKSPLEIERTLQTLAYYTAAALSVNSRQATKLIKLMLQCVTNTTGEVSSTAAKTFRILLAPSSILTPDNFCNIWLLRQGKLFGLTFAPLRDMWLAGDRDVKNNALIALAGVLGYLGPEAYIDNLHAPVLLRLVLDGMGINGDCWTKATFIKTLNNLVLLRPDLFQEHLRSAIHRLTDRTHNTWGCPSDSNASCRVLALETLRSIIQTQPVASVLNEKKHLEAELSLAIDDISRNVRDRAQKCKTALACLVDIVVS